MSVQETHKKYLHVYMSLSSRASEIISIYIIRDNYHVQYGISKSVKIPVRTASGQDNTNTVHN